MNSLNSIFAPPGAWKYLEANILPYIIDWVFIFVLGILMAGLSFGLDYIISKILTGGRYLHSDLSLYYRLVG